MRPTFVLREANSCQLQSCENAECGAISRGQPGSYLALSEADERRMRSGTDRHPRSWSRGARHALDGPGPRGRPRRRRLPGFGDDDVRPAMVRSGRRGTIPRAATNKQSCFSPMRRTSESRSPCGIRASAGVGLLVVHELLRLAVEHQRAADAIGNVGEVRQRGRQVPFEHVAGQHLRIVGTDRVDEVLIVRRLGRRQPDRLAAGPAAGAGPGPFSFFRRPARSTTARSGRLLDPEPALRCRRTGCRYAAVPSSLV